MNKTLLIISREYLSRVKKKSFIIMTFLGPILISGIWIVPIWLGSQGVEEKRIQVLDESGLFVESFRNTEDIIFEVISDGEVEEKKQLVRDDQFDGLLLIPKIDIYEPEGITLFTESSPGIELVNTTRGVLESEIEAIKMEESGIAKEDLDRIKTDIDLGTINLTASGEEESNTAASFGAGSIFSIMIYMFIFIYGVQVMRGVIEEKSNKIVEVIISSVKPFQLMLGKILGVAAVVITQLLLWIALSSVITVVFVTLTGVNPSATADPAAIEQGNEMANKLVGMMMGLDLNTILFSFVFYFLGGYLLYAALFAAVGSAVDSDADTQQFMLPITIPLVLALVISTTVIIKDPHGTMAFWISIIPFTSPIAMMMRVPFGVPMWELALSMTLLVAGFIFTTWLAGRIYRVGILMHGAKVNYKVLYKWFFMKN